MNTSQPSDSPSSAPNMSNIVQKVVNAARFTFARHQQGSAATASVLVNKDDFSTSLAELKRLVNLLTAKDLGLEQARALLLQAEDLEGASAAAAEGSSSSPNASSSPNKRAKRAPITYIDVYENKDVTVGIFIIHKGCKIPLHNHPNMSGIIKCLYGQVDMTSFTPLQDSDAKEVDLPDSLRGHEDLVEQGLVFPATKELFHGLNPNSKCCCLSAHDRNYHELSAVRGPAAFIDILAPPYSPEEDENEDERRGEDRRDCNFYREVKSDSSEVSQVSWLQWIDAPSDYFCDSEEYRGPLVKD